MASEFTGRYGQHWYSSPQAFHEQLPANFGSDFESSQALQDPQCMYQWQIAADEWLDENRYRPSDFNRHEQHVNLMQHNGLAFENGDMNHTVNDQPIENGAVGTALQVQLPTAPLVDAVNQEVEHAYQPAPPISPLPLENFPPVPFQNASHTSFEPHDQTVNSIPPFSEEQILQTNFGVLPEIGSISTVYENTFYPGDLVAANWSLATSPFLNVEVLRYSNTRVIVEPSQHRHVIAGPSLPLVKLDFNKHEENSALNDHPPRLYMPFPSQLHSNGHSRKRCTAPFSTSHTSRGHKRLCEWEGKCGGYVCALTILSHIRLHVTLELADALDGVATAKNNVQYTLKPSTMARFRFENLLAKDKAMIVMDRGKVWAKCLWGGDGGCFCRDKLPLKVLLGHVVSIHLGLEMPCLGGYR